MMTRTKSIGTLAALLLAALPTLAQAQAGQTRAGWQPYLGCWKPNAPTQAQAATGGQAAAEGGILCFVPSGADVEMLTILDGAITHREGYFADGQPHPVEQDGCRGTESARFSEDGLRLYTTSELTCDNGTVRSSTGIISMPGPGEWLDVRALQANGGTTAWSQWYDYADDSVLEELGLPRRSEPLPLVLRGSEFFAAARVTIDDVIDASRNVDAKAVAGWLAQVRQEFDDLGAEELVRLDDAGVPAEVIDVVVAVSFPRHFALGDGRALADEYGSDRRGRRVFMTPLGYYYPPSVLGYGYGSRYGYPGYYGYGYGSYGYGWGGYYTPVAVDVNRAPSRSSGGRVVAGRGYRGPRSVSTGGYYGGRSGGISSGSGRSGSVGSASSGSGSSGRTAKRRGGK
jgi:hypothetical protein